MGPSTANNPPAPNRGNKLPVPDVEGVPQSVIISPTPDNSLATRKWFTISLIIAGIMATAGLVVFITYVIVSNTPGYMFSAAMQNLVKSDGEAGSIRYDIQQGKRAVSTTGNFLIYTDPTNPNARSLTLSLGQGDARLSGTARLLAESNYTQVAGLGNLGRLARSLGSTSTSLTNDKLLRLSSLDGQWYTLTSDDVFDLRHLLPPQVQAEPTGADINTLRQLYLDHPFLIAAQQLADERIEGNNTMHLKAGLDQTKLSEFLRSLKAANIKWLTLSDNDIQAIQNSQLPSQIDAEVWISRSDRTFQQIRLTQPATGRTLTLTFKSELAAAQRQTVVRPESAKSMTSFVRGIQDILASPSAPAAQ